MFLSWLTNYPLIKYIKSLPNMSSDTGILMISPVNSHVVCFASIPDVPSNTYGEKEFKNAKIKVAVSVDKQHILIRI